jgi:hypothetical protein
MRKRNTNAPSAGCRVVIFSAAMLLPLALTSCGKKGQNGETQTAQKSEDDLFGKAREAYGAQISPGGETIFIVVAKRNYSDAYPLLSSHAWPRRPLAHRVRPRC